MRSIASTILLLSLALPACARDPLNPKEVDELREAKQMPNERIKLLVQFARARMLAIQQVLADPQLTDRPQQVHDLLDDFNILTDELDDNLDMYTREKADFRKSLKLAIEAYSEWQVKLRTIKQSAKPDELKQFSFALETAVENVNAGADTTRELLAEQEASKGKKKDKDDKEEKQEKTSSEH